MSWLPNKNNWNDAVWEAMESPTPATDDQVGGDHYKRMAIQPIEYTMRNNLGYNEGTVIAYVSRHEFKNGAEDIKKAIQHLQFILQYKYGEENDGGGTNEQNPRPTD